MLKAALIGYGGISKAHEKGYVKLEAEGKVKLVAACDVCKEAFESRSKINIDIGSVEVGKFNRYTDLEEMLANEELDFVDICVPSYLHKELTIKLLKRGYNVLCEKPMALNGEDCNEMLEAEKASGKHLMIAQVLRFSPEYECLKACIDDGKYGKVLGAYFERISAQPTWGFERWFEDYDRSGGATTDMHIHDIDMARYLFGEPDAVSCRASDCKTRYDIVHTNLFYGDTPVLATSSWSAGRLKFSSAYRVDFEKATIVFGKGMGVTIYTDEDGKDPITVELKGHDGYTGEISFFCDVVEGKVVNTKNPASSAATTVRLIDAMKRSADMGGEIVRLK